MLKLYIFDMGGVVCSLVDVIPMIARQLNISSKTFYKLAGDDTSQLEVGSIEVEEFWIRFSQRLGRSVEKEYFSAFFHPGCNETVRHLVLDLKQRARIVVGTNTIKPHYACHLNEGHYDIFDAVYASNLMGVVKPDPEFYQRILKAESCIAEEAAFIDDTERNVLAARELGIHSHVYTGEEELRSWISSL